MSCRYHTAFQGMCNDSNSNPEIRAFIDSINCGKNCSAEDCSSDEAHFIMDTNTANNGSPQTFLKKRKSDQKLFISEELADEIYDRAHMLSDPVLVMIDNV